jgi:hypothetical protein
VDRPADEQQRRAVVDRAQVQGVVLVEDREHGDALCLPGVDLRQNRCELGVQVCSGPVAGVEQTAGVASGVASTANALPCVSTCSARRRAGTCLRRSSAMTAAVSRVELEGIADKKRV